MSIKVKLKKSGGQKNIDNQRVTAHIKHTKVQTDQPDL